MMGADEGLCKHLMRRPNQGRVSSHVSDLLSFYSSSRLHSETNPSEQGTYMLVWVRLCVNVYLYWS